MDVARAGQSVAMKIEAVTAAEQSRLFGRHFDHTDALVSLISRESIDALKAYFKVLGARVGASWAAGVHERFGMCAWRAPCTCAQHGARPCLRRRT